MVHVYYPLQVKKNSQGQEYHLEHWCLIIGKDDGKYKVYDPYFGETGYIDETMMYYKDYGNDNNTCKYEYGIIEVTHYD